MKKYTKTIFKEFRSGFGRFIAIAAIIAVGVGFMIGITQATPDMKNSMDAYFGAQSAYDIDVKSVYGLSDDDMAAITQLTDDDGKALTETVMPYISTDVPVTVNTSVGASESSARINGVDFDNFTVNKLTVEEGRLPENDGECVVQRGNNTFLHIGTGTEITISGDGTLDSASGSVYGTKMFTVVGVVSSPEYYYLGSRETTTIGNGVIGVVMYVNLSVYDLSANPVYAMSGATYTDAAIILDGSDGYTVFTDAYDDYVVDRSDAFSALGTERCSGFNAALEAMGLDIPRAQWYALDVVSTNPSYIGFGMNADKVADIAGIFPVFFIVVAALVALTSMTRMVEEQRSQIGVLKALGYSNGRIMRKYLIYCSVASITGCVLGSLFGFSILPTIIWQAYGIMYYLPALHLAFSPLYAAVVLLIALALTLGVTLYAGIPTFREKPSQLMQQKAPKAGKRILLERCGFFWKHLKFKHKATLRNIFRYKKNMIMTIISVMGCTALIFIGFALSNSISTTIDVQFTDIVKYDLSVKYESVNEGGELYDFLENNDNCRLYSEDGTVTLNSGAAGRETVTLYALHDGSAEQFVSVRGRDGEITSIEYGGVGLAKNIADEYGVKTGDTIEYTRTDGSRITFTVNEIVENYVAGYVYVDFDYFNEVSGGITENTALVALSESADQDALSQRLFTDGEVSAVTFASVTRDMYGGLEEIMGYIIAVLVVSAGALAAIVLYNLTNINIDERRKEIATLRVLGYTHGEVAGYIYRESAVLVIIGALLGLGLGALLNMFMIARINGAAVSFMNVAGVLSYFAGFGLTVAFAAIVYAFMLIKLRRIDMADSLKSNE